jgi:hypothetical protein
MRSISRSKIKEGKMLGRRSAFGIIVFLAVLCGGEAKAALVDIENLGKALGDAADAVGKLGDSIAHLVTLGANGWNAVSASRTRDRLTDISARLSILVGGQIGTLKNIDEYIDTYCTASRCESSLGGAGQGQWFNIHFAVEELTGDISDLLEELERERSGLVTQDVYQDLISTLHARVRALKELDNTAPPSRPDEVRALRAVSARYSVLVANLRDAIRALNAYIAMHNS